jgi:hypothetical protein
MGGAHSVFRCRRMKSVVRRMKSLVIGLLSLAWAKVLALSVYPPVIRTHAALAYMALSASITLNALLIWSPDRLVEYYGPVLAVAGTEVAYTSLFLGLAGSLMCCAYRARCGRPSYFLLSASYAAWTSVVLAVFSPAIIYV